MVYGCKTCNFGSHLDEDTHTHTHTHRGDRIRTYRCLQNKQSFCVSHCPAILQQKLLSRPWFGALEAYVTKSLIFRRSVFVHRHRYHETMLTQCLRVEVTWQAPYHDAMRYRRPIPIDKLYIVMSMIWYVMTWSIGWYNNNFNNLHFKKAFETNQYIHVSNTNAEQPFT